MSFNPKDFEDLFDKDKTETERLCRKIFSTIDTDGSGFIDKPEMISMMKAYAAFGFP